MILALDLSTTRTGFAFFNKGGRLVKQGTITPAKDISPLFKINYIVQKIEKIYKKIDDLVIEDIYYGKNVKGLILLGRLSGAVIDSWIRYKYKEPFLYTAVQYRPIVGIKGNATKSEVQVWVLENFSKVKPVLIKKYKEEIIKLKTQRKLKEIKTSQYNYRIKVKLSKLIEKETGYGEDVSDAITLGMAHYTRMYRK